MRARPEPTQLEHLSDASFLGKLLVLPANVRLDWKVIAKNKHSSLLDTKVGDEEKRVLQNVHQVSMSYNFFPSLLMTRPNKLECL